MRLADSRSENHPGPGNSWRPPSLIIFWVIVFVLYAAISILLAAKYYVVPLPSVTLLM